MRFNCCYLADGPDSAWLAPQANGNAGATGFYVYQTTFDLTGLDPSTAILEGGFSTDNNGAVSINSAPVAQTSGFGDFGFLTSFSITSGFVAGLNTFSIAVNNGGDPTAFRVEFTRAEADLAGPSAVPEPSTYALFGSGLN